MNMHRFIIYFFQDINLNHCNTSLNMSQTQIIFLLSHWCIASIRNLTSVESSCAGKVECLLWKKKKKSYWSPIHLILWQHKP